MPAELQVAEESEILGASRVLSQFRTAPKQAPEACLDDP